MILLLALLSCAPQQFDDQRKMLYRALEEECAQALSARRKSVEQLQTPEAVRRRQQELRAKYLAALGPFPERTPLRARTIRTIAREGYRVENVVYESRPEHHVPANLYVPEGNGPFPGILFPLGHYSWPRAAEEYQRSCILLAKHGFVVLTYDPPGQGERHQLVAHVGPPAAHGTTEHTLIDCGARLVGSCAANVWIWDAMRGLDYLESRPEVDLKRLGCAGNSGGGTTTALLMAADERVACAVPNCFITTWEKLYAAFGPQDGEANIPARSPSASITRTSRSSARPGPRS
jgi:dipeptidyl aminopeptidase/acylaminoacyl peptidase